ncbi:MAG: hypothetical protein DMG89_02620 [Acidobacteria bacterium]|nr:MAG: hypothetical protein DMG89_02620 [Acidobacteriota bacterium]
MKMLSDTAVERLREAADAPDLSGTRYRLLGKLGEGGMAGVYRVEDTALNREIALKVVSLVDSSGDLAARLLQEARVIAQLEHPGIVPVHDAGTLADGRVFYTMKLVQGRSLDQCELGGLPERLRLFHKICEPVSFAHCRGVLHRDLKPQNIMVGAFGEVLVMDWGLSKLLGGSERPGTVDELVGAETKAVTAHGTIMGTPGYMAPEQGRGESATVDQRADIYSLGTVLRFLMRALVVPRAVRAIAAKATEADPALRYRSVEEFSRDIAHYLDGLPVSAYPEGPLGKVWRWGTRNRVWILLLLAYLVMRVGLILWRTR